VLPFTAFTWTASLKGTVWPSRMCCHLFFLPGHLFTDPGREGVEMTKDNVSFHPLAKTTSILVLLVLFWLLCSGCSVLAVSFWLSHSGSPILAITGTSCHVMLRLSCPSFISQRGSWRSGWTQSQSWWKLGWSLLILPGWHPKIGSWRWGCTSHLVGVKMGLAFSVLS
jgi:hypothetical protein